jgi:hypothetical protein
MTTIYKVSQHNLQNIPDGRDVCFVGEPREADRFYCCDLTHEQRVTHGYLFSDDGCEAVGYRDWPYAGIDSL